MGTALNAEFLRELSLVAEEDSLMEKVSKYVHRLLKKQHDDTVMTEAEFRKKLEISSAQGERGEYFEMRKDETVDQFVDRMLCIQ